MFDMLTPKAAMRHETAKEESYISLWRYSQELTTWLLHPSMEYLFQYRNRQICSQYPVAGICKLRLLLDCSMRTSITASSHTSGHPFDPCIISQNEAQPDPFFLRPPTVGPGPRSDLLKQLQHLNPPSRKFHPWKLHDFGAPSSQQPHGIQLPQDLLRTVHKRLRESHRHCFVARGWSVSTLLGYIGNTVRKSFSPFFSAHPVQTTSTNGA